VEVGATEQVEEAAARFKEAGLATFEENDTSCCYAVQDKVWVTGPGQEPWEVYVVKRDGTSLENRPADCCTGEGCTNDCCSTDAADTSAQVTTSA
jgi:hypothetical protein